MSKLENIQKRALRFVYDDFSSSYEELLLRDFLSLSLYRIYFLAIEVYKCIKGVNLSYINDLFKKKCSIGYNLRDSDLLVQPKFNAYTYGYKSFSYLGAKLWNALPSNVKLCDSLPCFKRELKSWCQGPYARNISKFSCQLVFVFYQILQMYFRTTVYVL